MAIITEEMIRTISSNVISQLVAYAQEESLNSDTSATSGGPGGYYQDEPLKDSDGNPILDDGELIYLPKEDTANWPKKVTSPFAGLASNPDTQKTSATFPAEDNVEQISYGNVSSLEIIAATLSKEIMKELIDQGHYTFNEDGNVLKWKEVSGTTSATYEASDLVTVDGPFYNSATSAYDIDEKPILGDFVKKSVAVSITLPSEFSSIVGVVAHSGPSTSTTFMSTLTEHQYSVGTETITVWLFLKYLFTDAQLNTLLAGGSSVHEFNYRILLFYK